jgi:hypothetical protein
MSLGYELVVFGKFIKFILMSTLYNSGQFASRLKFTMFTINIYKRAQSAQCALAPYFQQLRSNARACNVHSNVHNVHFSTSYGGQQR